MIAVALSISVLILAALPTHAILGRPAVTREEGQSIPGLASVVSIVVDKGQEQGICTGVALSPRWVLTAGHCFHSVHSLGVSVQVGLDIRDHRLAVSEIIFHPQYAPEAPYDEQSKSHDFALLRMRQDLPSSVGFAELIKERDESIVESLKKPRAATLAGFGRSRSDWRGLQDDQVGLLRTDQSQITGYSNQYHYFILKQSPDHGVCSGDSGGPLFYRLPSGQVRLAGIARGAQPNRDLNANEIKEMRQDTEGFLRRKKDVHLCGGFGFFSDIRPQVSWVQQTIR